KYTMDFMGRYYDWVLGRHDGEFPPLPDKSLVTLADEAIPDLAQEGIGPYLESVRILGQRTGEMHVALASATGNPAFDPEPFTDLTRRSLYQSLRNLTSHTFTQLRRQLRSLPDGTKDMALRALESEGEVLHRFRTVFETRTGGRRTRIHGDYHLGQVLYTGRDFVIIDFEGEPARPLSERRLKRSPLRDVAGMIRSFHYAPHAALLGQAPMVIRDEDKPILQQWGEYCCAWVSAAFLNSYLQAARQSNFLPRSVEELRELLDAYILEKAVYEVGYELNNRPNWVGVPLRGILQLLEAQS
ncbi:MAG: maltose alpha-D-glucosyltransferase, partial [Ardenticatenaceae bacterium]